MAGVEECQSVESIAIPSSLFGVGTQGGDGEDARRDTGRGGEVDPHGGKGMAPVVPDRFSVAPFRLCGAGDGECKRRGSGWEKGSTAPLGSDRRSFFF